MRISRNCLLALTAATLAVFVPNNANAQAQLAHPPVALSQQARQAHAEADIPHATSMAADYANAIALRLKSDPLCEIGGSIILADGLVHRCQ